MLEGGPAPAWQRFGAAAGLVAGAGAYVFLPPSPALAGAVVYVVAAAACPILALQLVILSTPFYLFAKGAASLPFTPTEFLLLGATVSWLGRAGWEWVARGRRPALSLGQPDWPLLLFVVGALAATFAATNLGAHVRQLRVVVFEPLVFYWLARRHAREASGFLALLDALVLAGVAVGLYAIYQYFFTTDTIVAEGVGRVRGLYGSPNNLGLFLERAALLCACLGIWGGRRRGLYAAALAPIGVALGLTFSLGAWLGVAAGMLFAAVVGSRRRLALGIVGALVLTVAAGWFVGLPRIVSHFSLEAGTWRWRLFVWQAGWEMARAHPVLGVGLDNFFTLYPHYMAPEAWPEPGLSHPHNLVLDFWLSTGIAGLVGGLWLIGRLWWRALALWQRGMQPELRAAGLGLAASVVAVVVHGAFDNSYFLVDLALVFWLYQALAAAQQPARRSAMIAPAVASAYEGKEEGQPARGSWPQLP